MRRLQAKFFLGPMGIATLAVLVTGSVGGLALFPDMALGLLFAAVLSALAARFYTEFTVEPLRALESRLRALNADQLEPHLAASVRDEKERLAASAHRTIDLIAERRRSLRRAFRRLEAVFAAMGEGVLVLDRESQILGANPAFRELLGVWGQIEGRPVVEIIRHAEIQRLIEEVRTSQTPVLRDIEVHPPSQRVLLTHGISIPAEGPRDGLLIVFHDVTELRRVDKVRRDFVANASHELKTPLTAIQGYAETLAAGSLSAEEAAPQLAVILRNAKRMSQLIDDLMVLSRIEEAPPQAERSAVDVYRIAQRLIADLGPRIENAQLSAHLEPLQASALAWADRQAIEQILENLLTNAIRYTDAGGRITIRLASDGDALEVAVEDTGIGIPEAALDRIFERFYRVDSSRPRAVGSTGLGLSIARRLAESLGGSLSATSQLGTGSCFRLKLPRPPADATEPSLSD